MLVRCVCVLLSLLLVGCGSTSSPTESTKTTPTAVQLEILGDLGIDPTQPIDPEDAAYRARDFISSHQPYARFEEDFSLRSNYEIYQDLRAGRAHLLCSGMTQMMHFIGRKAGLKVRPVVIGTADFFARKRAPDDSHVLPEVWINGRWVVFDPTFDTTYHCGGDGPALSAAEMVACRDNITWTYGPYRNDGRVIERLSYPFSDLLHGWLELK